MLIFKSLTLAYSDRPLFSGLDFTLNRGQLVGVTGESGTGKTSLLRAIVGVIPITAGAIEVCGLPLDVHHIHAIRQNIAYVPQELQPPAEDGAALIALTHALAFNRALLASQPTSPAGRLTPQPSARPNGTLHTWRTLNPQLPNRGGVGGGASLNHKPSARPNGTLHTWRTLNSQLTALAIDPALLSLEASKLSGGQRQRILLAAALALPKPLLLLDEPTSALDEENSQRVALALLRACHEEGRAALVVSHDPVFLRFCDKVLDLTNL